MTALKAPSPATFAWIRSLRCSTTSDCLPPLPLMPTASRISPGAKLGQLFSVAALRGLIKSLLPAAAVAYLGVGCLRRDWPTLMLLSRRSYRGVLVFAARR